MKKTILRMAEFAIIVTLLCLECNDIGANNSSQNGTGEVDGFLGRVSGMTTFIDNRDGKMYKIVTIGNQTWMADNMNYQMGNSWCYGNYSSNCDKYGRLYDWNTARIACPAGWHLSTYQEWDILAESVGGRKVSNYDDPWHDWLLAETKLKTKSGWNNSNGTNDYGFSALPSGYRYGDSRFYAINEEGDWWTASEYDSDSAYFRYISYLHEQLDDAYQQKNHGFSVRCVQDIGNSSTMPTYTLTTSVVPPGGGIVSRNPNQTNYIAGAYVTVTAMAASGYTFIGWSGASFSTNASVTIPVDRDKVLRAYFFDINDAIEMVSVAGGTFTMGCTMEQGGNCRTDEKPSHSVTLDAFYIGRYEVTQGLWKAVMGSNPSYHIKNDNLPVEGVSWNEVQTFIQTLNSKTGKTYRLPTEAEWEYAARGGASSRGYKYSGSNTIGDVAWYSGNSSDETHPVGTKLPNELGIYDMSGNVWEWVSDWYGDYTSSNQTNPIGPSIGTSRADRGGSRHSDAEFRRVSIRNRSLSDNKFSDLGFRLVRSSQ